MKDFFCKTRIISGTDILSVIESLGFRRIFLVCDPYFVQNGQADALQAAVHCPHWAVFSDITAEPTVELAAKGAALVKKFAPDGVIALGGGSAMDCAKAMTYFSGHPAKLVAIPTTSGSGSEVTDFAILTHEGVKHPLVDPSIRPDIAILDSNLVESLPAALIAEGGFDLISHALEAYVATNADPISDLLAEESLHRAFSHLQASFQGDRSARVPLHTAATMAGIAFSNAGLGLCHGISHSLGGTFHIPHGRLNAILLPAVMEANATAGCHRYAQLAKRIGLGSGGDAMAFRGLKSALLRLRRNLRLPDTLLQAGISPPMLREKMDELVSAALADPCCQTNPLPVTDAVVRRVLTEVMGRE